MKKPEDLFNRMFPAAGRLVLIAGPCVIESEALALETAGEVKKIAAELGITFIFKSSYTKSNRTTVDNYSGPGMKKGLKILEKVKEKHGLPVLTDIHCRAEVEPVSKVADIIQIPAYLCQQTEMTVMAAKTGRIINIKKGQFLSPWDIKKVAEKVESTGNKKVFITERGNVFGYNNLVVDMRCFSMIKEYGYPVIFDVTHAVRIPGFTSTDSRGGQPQYVKSLSLAGIAAGADGLFIETHPKPLEALCDAKSMLPLKELKSILKKAVGIYNIVKGEK